MGEAGLGVVGRGVLVWWAGLVVGMGCQRVAVDLLGGGFVVVADDLTRLSGSLTTANLSQGHHWSHRHQFGWSRDFAGALNGPDLPRCGTGSRFAAVRDNSDRFSLSATTANPDRTPGACQAWFAGGVVESPASGEFGCWAGIPGESPLRAPEFLVRATDLPVSRCRVPD